MFYSLLVRQLIIHALGVKYPQNAIFEHLLTFWCQITALKCCCKLGTTSVYNLCYDVTNSYLCVIFQKNINTLLTPPCTTVFSLRLLLLLQRPRCLEFLIELICPGFTCTSLTLIAVLLIEKLGKGQTRKNRQLSSPDTIK